MARLSVVVPTLGRPSLARTLASCADADEIVLVLDTARGGHLPCEIAPNVVFTTGHFGVTGGHAGRVHGIGLATGTHLAFMDDDDVYVPGAMDLMRDAASDVPVIFRMDHYSHGILWRDQEVKFGNVSTQMYLVPNDPERLGRWEPHIPGIKEPGGDYTFMVGCVQRMGGPIWREEIVAVLRPTLPRPWETPAGSSNKVPSRLRSDLADSTHTSAEERLAPSRATDLGESSGPTITVVTPWLEHLELLDDYTAAMDLGPTPSECLIVDNGSNPALPFAALYPGVNLGFAGGCNFGLRAAESEVVVFLNNDIYATEQGWLEKLAFQVEPGVLVGAQLRHDRHAGVDGHPLPYLDGWCLAGMREDLLSLGGFDETLEEPSYYSDNLLCLEARAAGMMLREVRVGIHHKLNKTAGPAHQPHVRQATEANRARYIARARELLVAA